MAHPRPSSGLDPNAGELRNTLSQEAIDFMLEELHSFFGEWSAVEDYKVATSPGDPATQLQEQKLFISYQTPEDDRFLPAIVVRLSGFTQVDETLGKAWENLPGGGKRYGGYVKTTYRMTVASLSSVDLDRITDYLYLFLSIVKVPDLQTKGIWLYPNSVSVSDAGPMKYTESQSILRNTVTVDAYLHWFTDVPNTDATVTNIGYFLQTKERLDKGFNPKYEE